MEKIRNSKVQNSKQGKRVYTIQIDIVIVVDIDIESR